MENQHPWCQRMLTPLSDKALLSCPVAEDDLLWEAIEGQMLKVGSLSHGQLDLNAVAEQCLSLMESKTKDMRVLAHLLHCLQQQGTPALFGTSLELLDGWLGAYWNIAAPDNRLKKQRIMSQIISRFERSARRVVEKSCAAERDHLLQQIQHLHDRWQTLTTEEQREQITPLLTILKRVQQQPPVSSVQSNTLHTSLSASCDSVPLVVSSIPVLADISDERGWKQILLSVAHVLTENCPDQDIGYRLRRHAIWHGITAVPPSRNGKTELAAVAADRINEYCHALEQSDYAVWQQIEYSLTLSPYWFDGHRLSAQIATQQNRTRAASAISEELTLLLQRLPALKTLCFSDGTPFLSPECASWLQAQQPAVRDSDTGSLCDEIRACHQQDGLNAALTLVNQRLQQQSEPRSRFYIQLALAELLDNAGNHSLAQQYYKHLWQETQRLVLEQWEPQLVRRLQQHTEQITGE